MKGQWTRGNIVWRGVSVEIKKKCVKSTKGGKVIYVIKVNGH